jgi:hypothetical protein
MVAGLEKSSINSKGSCKIELGKINNFNLVKYKQNNKELSKKNSYCELIKFKNKRIQRKREMSSLLLFIFFLFVTILTLSQILGKLIFFKLQNKQLDKD